MLEFLGEVTYRRNADSNSELGDIFGFKLLVNVGDTIVTSAASFLPHAKGSKRQMHCVIDYKARN